MEEHKEEKKDTTVEKDETQEDDPQSEEPKLPEQRVTTDEEERKESSEKPHEEPEVQEAEPVAIDEETNPDGDKEPTGDTEETPGTTDKGSPSADTEQPAEGEDESVDEDDEEEPFDETGEGEEIDEEDAEPALPTPTQKECLALLKELDSPKELIDHSKAVAELAQKICDMYDLHNDQKCDAQIVVAGALLHDVGRVKTHELSHNIEGSKIVRERGYSKELSLLVERHVGAGIDVSEAEELGLPRRNYIPQKLEERIVSHADNLIEDTTRIKVQDLIRKLVNQDELKFAARLIRLHNKLSKLCGVEIDEIE